MKKLLIYLKEYKKECILAPLFKMSEALFELFVPLVVASIIDTGIANRDVSFIIKSCGLLFLLALIGLLCAVTAQYFSAKAATGFAAKLRHALFVHIEQLSYTNIDKAGTSTLITRMTSDINQTQSGVNMTLRLFLRSPFIVFGAMIMAFTIDFKASLIFLATIIMLSVVVFGIMKITMPLYKKVQNLLDNILGITRENLTGVRVIRAFNKEEAELQNFITKNEEYTAMQKFVGKISALTNPVTYIIVNCATLILLWTGAISVDNGILTQGMVVALVNYMSQILVELIKLANLIITITKAFASADRIASVLEIPSGQKIYILKNSDSKAIVEFDNVSLTYENAKEKSLSNLSFKAMPGETIGIIGGTGSGKTSLINLIPRFYDTTEGEVYFKGENVKNYDSLELRKHIGIVMQKAVLFKGTIRDNLRLGNENATDDELIEALKISQSLEFVKTKEGFLDYFIEQDGKNLSGGQRQRLTIARALVKKPEVLILDDSSSALDYATDAALRKSIKAISDSLVTFIVSSRASNLMHADKIIVLEDGEVCAIASHDELLKSCSTYQEIYYSQFPKED